MSRSTGSESFFIGSLFMLQMTALEALWNHSSRQNPQTPRSVRVGDVSGAEASPVFGHFYTPMRFSPAASTSTFSPQWSGNSPTAASTPLTVSALDRLPIPENQSSSASPGPDSNTPSREKGAQKWGTVQLTGRGHDLAGMYTSSLRDSSLK